jgi:biotin carboxylase
VGNRDVLSLGWHVKTVRAFEHLGRRVVCAVEPRDLGKASAHCPAEDVVVVSSTGNLESVLSGLARAGIDPAGFEAVFSIHELPLVTAAALAQLAGRPVLPVGSAVALRDKFVQKTKIRAAGLRAADCQVVPMLHELKTLPWQGPRVVKLLADSGARDTFLLRDAEDLAALLDRAVPGRSSGPWLAEEFIDGRELHLDGVVRGGKLLFCSVSRYLQNVIAVRSGGVIGSILLDPAAHEHLYEQARGLTVRALRALGHTDGVFHIEVFADEHGLVFSECAGRIGGGMIPDVNLQAFGVDLIEEFARAVLRLPSAADADVKPLSESCGFIQMVAPPGRITSMPSIEEVLSRPGCRSARLSLAEGDVVPDFSSGSHLMAGKALLAAENDKELERRMRKLAKWFRRNVTTSTLGA